MNTGINTLLAGTGVISAPSTAPHLLDINPDQGAIVGCIESNDRIFHRSTSKDWTEQSYGVLPYTRLEGVTPENILIKTHLNWEVRKQPLFTKYGDSEIVVPNNYATVRSDTNEVLGVVGGRYTILQNEQLIDVVKPFMDIEDLCLESGGYFADSKNQRAGHRVYLQFKLPTFITVKGDETEQMLFISNAHDGTSNIVIGLTSIRTVCRNTFQMNLRNASIRVRHSANMDVRINEAHKTLEIANKLTSDLNAIFNQMANVSVDSKKVREILTLVASENEENNADSEQSTQMVNRLRSMESWVEKEMSSATALNGNLYGVWNGITAYYNHGVNHRGDRYNNILHGTPSKKMNKAFNIMQDLVTA